MFDIRFLAYEKSEVYSQEHIFQLGSRLLYFYVYISAYEYLYGGAQSHSHCLSSLYIRHAY